MAIYEKTFLKLKDFENNTIELIKELEAEKVHKKEIDKVRTLLTKIDICKRAFNDK
ncbi:hypothetical protein K5L04_10425 [Flavobacterium psychrophilum]|uniref:hypothetical protein n=1 Tax=Flavobacterium psychrophilum TaxID=96345 RepID=UPI001C8F42F6|nr:hypothetical protein [Flavobacterium psychrophilum]QZL00108.1 hypothetical protein K5L04_10425 [Flavobacterium psychrophilum]